MANAAPQESPAQRAARLHAEALAAWQARQAASYHEAPARVGVGTAAAPPRPQTDQRSIIQRILDGLSG